MKNVAKTSDDVANLIAMTYNSIVQQTRMKNYPNNLRVATFENEKVETTAALKKVCKHILQLSRKVTAEQRGDEHRIEFFLQAVVGYQ